jgi:hypothetical protein
MKKPIAIALLFLALAWLPPLCVSLSNVASAKGDDFNAAVKLVERFYGVKHKSIPFLARAGIKSATTVARIAGGQKRQIAEAGSVQVAYFEDQDFNPSSGFANFKVTMNAVLGSWSPLLQVASGKDQEQTHVYLRETGDKFNVLVVTIDRRDGCIVQVTVSPKTLATLLKDPDDMGRAITSEATTEDQ